MTWRRGSALILLAAVLGGCGYHFAGAGPDIPNDARTISVRLFGNRTRELGLEVHLRQAIADEFRRRGPLRVAEGREGDLVLSGEIRHFASVPVAFSATDQAVQYQGILQISVKLTDARTKRVLRENRLLQATQDFGAVQGVVITTSPHFQQGTIDARDLQNFTSVVLSETRRREALRGLLDILARDVYLQTMEGF
jgi:lipopolysaccharide assembly LptE-like protein